MIHFPVYIPFGPFLLEPHWVFESLAYFLGYRLYLKLRAQNGDTLTDQNRLSIITAAIVGAALGSKILYWFSEPSLTWQNLYNPSYLMGGKTIVGGLIGGLIAVELIKWRLGIRKRTGDLFAIPLPIGIAIGRVGCFLAGLPDKTYGIATTLPWGIDFGDGIARHPTQLYEIIWNILLAFWLYRHFLRPHREGDIFKRFMIGYLGFRLLIEFIKPGVPIVGLTAIQWVCLAIILYYWRDLPDLFLLKESKS